MNTIPNDHLGTLPKGCYTVHEGNLQLGDQVWMQDPPGWVRANYLIGEPVSSFQAACRPMRGYGARNTLPTDAPGRKTFPVHSGGMAYFPDAYAAVANCSYRGNEQHHAGKPLHWDREKSHDHLDAWCRHNIDDIKASSREERLKEKAAKAWRSLADYQDYHDGRGAYAEGGE